MYVVCFNGPPESGKDSLSAALVEVLEDRHPTLPIREVSLSQPLREIAYKMAGWTGPTDGPNYALFKKSKFTRFGGRTGRQLMIDVSEAFLKAQYGQEIMAEILLESLVSFEGIVLVRDSGFQIEVDTIGNEVDFERLCVVRVNRPGKDFTNDSREWVTNEVGPMTRIDNNGTLDDMPTLAARLYGRLVNNFGWKL